MTASAPLVRNQHGAILGIDWRRTPLAAADVKVPGHVPARAVMPGDTIRHEGQDVVVLTKRVHGAPGMVYIGTRSTRGAEVVFERRLTDVIDVVAVGAFDGGPDACSAGKFDLIRPVCPFCWTEQAVDGSCLCEVR